MEDEVFAHLRLFHRDIHSKLLTDHNCKEGCVSSQSKVHVGTNDGLNSKDGDLHQKEDVTLIIPELNLLSEVSHVRGDNTSNVDVTVIPTQNRVTL